MTECHKRGDGMENLKKLRLEAKMTQVALQLAVGIDQSMISKYERGDRWPNYHELIVLAGFFNTSVDYLMGRTGERRPYPPAEK